MLITLWESISEVIIHLGGLGIVVILIIAFFHPTFEAPTAILLLTILTILVGSVWLASLLMLLTFSLGFIFYYWLVHSLHQRSGWRLEKMRLSQQALQWVKQQPTWKHILIIGLPLLYTYPLRLAFTLNHKKLLPYITQTFCQYVVLTIGNLLIYFGIMELIFLNAPWWVPSLVFFAMAFFIYASRKHQRFI